MYLAGEGGPVLGMGGLLRLHHIIDPPHTIPVPLTGARRCQPGREVDTGDGIQGACHIQVGMGMVWKCKYSWRKLVFDATGPPGGPPSVTLLIPPSCRSSDLRGKSVYHTNVMMAIGTGVAIVCAESVRDSGERANLLRALRKTHEV